VRGAPLLALVVLLAGCSGSGSSVHAAPTPSGNGLVGYIRMDAVLKVHPLYGQLAEYDANIEALNLGTLVPHALAAGPQLAREDAQLNAQLQAAAQRTNAILQAKGKQYEDRENAAIAAAMRQAASSGGGTTVGAVAAQMESTAHGQVVGAAAQAQRDLESYRQQLQAEDTAQIQAAQKTLAARAERAYRAKQDALNAQESALSLDLARQDAAQRLTLRTKLSSLAMDDTERDNVNAELDGLDKKESDTLTAQHAKDAATLAALQTQLQSQITTDMQQQVAQIHARSLQRYQERGRELQQQFAVPNGPLITTIQNGKPVTAVNPNLPPDLRRRIAQLHADYTKAFQTDAQTTIADFNKTRADLSQRYATLHGLGVGATASTQREIVSLQRKREELYDQMVAQIGREVKAIALERGVSVVVQAEAPAGGIDLTDAAMKDIESLHE
jgi:hypothetical protein